MVPGTLMLSAQRTYVRRPVQFLALVDGDADAVVAAVDAA